MSIVRAAVVQDNPVVFDTEATLDKVRDLTKKAVSLEAQLVVFPEATFLRSAGLLQFRLGAFAIACGTQSLVVPIAVTGTRSILRGGQWFPRRGAVNVEVLAPMVPTGHDFTAAVELRNRVRSEILAHCGEPDMAETEVVFAGNDNERTSA